MTAAEYALRLFGPEARWTYWQDGRGPMFVYNTERIRTRFGRAPDAKFESAVFVPVGPGSRSGKAKQWKELAGSRSAHELRRDAKDRAYRLYKAWKETGRVEL